MKQKKLYLVLIRGNTVLGKIIRWATQENYTHAAISLDKNLNNMYSFSRRHTNNPFIGCFRNENFDEGAYAHFYEISGSILEIQVTQEEYNQAVSIIDEFLENSNDYKYNYLGLVSNLAGINLHRKNRFLCSEFVYHVLNKSGICDFGLPRNLVRPQTLAQVKGNIIFDGNLRKYASYCGEDLGAPPQTPVAFCKKRRKNFGILYYLRSAQMLKFFASFFQVASNMTGLSFWYKKFYSLSFILA